MSDAQNEGKVVVRVLPERALSLRAGETTIAHRAGDELELDAGEAQELEGAGFVRVIKG